MRPLLERIEKGEIDPSYIVTHRVKLDGAPKAFDLFRDKQDSCIKAVLKPQQVISRGMHGKRNFSPLPRALVRGY